MLFYVALATTKSGDGGAASRVLWEFIIGGVAPSAPVYAVGDAVTVEWEATDGAGQHTASQGVVAAIGPGGILVKYNHQDGSSALINVPILQALPEPAPRLAASRRPKPPNRRTSVPKKERTVAKRRQPPLTPSPSSETTATAAAAASFETEARAKRAGFGCSKCAYRRPVPSPTSSCRVALAPDFPRTSAARCCPDPSAVFLVFFYMHAGPKRVRGINSPPFLGSQFHPASARRSRTFPRGPRAFEDSGLS